MIRHGQTEANLAKLWAGSLDSPLTALGREQAHQARLIVENLPSKPTIIYHSHLSRARDTASIINENLGLEMIEDPNLAEMHVGDLEGKPHDNWECTNKNWQDPPGGETVQQFIERIKKAKNNALSNPDHMPLIVCHGWVFRAFGAIYDLNAQGIKNCDLHQFTPNQSKEKFPWKSDTFHFDGKMTHKTSPIFHPK